MILYRFGNDGIEKIAEAAAADSKGTIVVLNEELRQEERVAYCVNHASQLGISQEDEGLLWQTPPSGPSPAWLKTAIEEERVLSVNGAHQDWQSWISRSVKKEWRVHVVGLGDVGGMLLAGLRLLGAGDIGELGIYDPDPAKCQRWHREIGQICTPFENDAMKIRILDLEELFDCDLFVFCASRSVPPLDGVVTDVRMVQFAGNAGILEPYAKRAVREAYSGIFAVVSDPVDQLCQFVQQTMEKTAEEDALTPLKADQIRGYGLGVMHGRAAWYAHQLPELASYLTEGRAYGPHGQGLVIADSVLNYHAENSLRLTELTLNANFEVRHAGFKPYVAPALSSGAIALIRTIRGQWHYSAISLGGIFMGCKNRLLSGIQETECLDLPETLKIRIRATGSILRKSL